MITDAESDSGIFKALVTRAVTVAWRMPASLTEKEALWPLAASEPADDDQLGVRFIAVPIDR